MSPVSDSMRAFFEELERASTTFARGRLAPLFSDPYLAADPNSRVYAVKREAFFQSMGFQFVKLVPLEETWLDTHYLTREDLMNVLQGHGLVP